jgi:MoxR-like ATPase
MAVMSDEATTSDQAPVPVVGGAGPGWLPPSVSGPDDMGRLLDAEDYLADQAMAVACFLSVAMRRPLFLEGGAGVGKTAVAGALARALGAPLLRLQCYEGIDASQALYDWNFTRQLLHLRAAEALGRHGSPEEVEGELYGRRFLVARPLLAALETSPCVLLIDEIDRADDEFEALLLEVLSEFSVSIPEIGTITAAVPPVVVITSNRTRDVHDALKRRCFYHWVDNPSFDREVAIISRRLPEVGARVARKVALMTRRLREEHLLKPPGVAEALDWATAMTVLGATDVDAETAGLTLGAVLKHREDLERVRLLELDLLLAAAEEA